jgi:hypothetical protein
MRALFRLASMILAAEVRANKVQAELFRDLGLSFITSTGEVEYYRLWYHHCM